MITEENTKILEDACASKPSCGCALSRLLAFLHSPALQLQKVGEQIGLSYHECSGIMDGWDVTVGDVRLGIFRWQYHSDESDGFRKDERPYVDDEAAVEMYEAGRKLGAALAQKYGL